MQLSQQGCRHTRSGYLATTDQLFTEFDESYVEPEPEIDEAKLRRNRYLAKPVSELELSVRASNCLETANIKTIRELVAKEEKDMLEYKNFGGLR